MYGNNLLNRIVAGEALPGRAALKDNPPFSENTFQIVSAAFVDELSNWEIDRVASPYWRCYYNPVPGAEVEVGGEVTELTPENFCLVPALLPMSGRLKDRPVRHFFIHFRLDERLPHPERVVIVPATPGARDRVAEFSRLREGAEFRFQRDLLAVNLLSEVLLGAPRLLEPEREFDRRITGIRTMIAADPARHRRNSELAALSGITVNGFVRLFFQETGESPQYFCRRKRIELVCRLLLATDLSIDEIAERAGFTDRYHLSRVFRAFTGVPPARFRRINSGGEVE